MTFFKNKDAFPYRFIKLFFKNQLSSAAAEMAYFCIFAFFPLLMVVHASFSMALSDFDIQNTLFYAMLPKEVEKLLNSYISQINNNSNLSFLFLGIFLTIYTLTKFMNSVKKTIRRIYHSHDYDLPIAEWGVSIVFSVLIILAFFVLLVLLILGGQILAFVEQNFTALNIIKLKSISRYVFTAAVIYSIITLFYLWIPNVPQKLGNTFPGTLFTSVCWVLVSWFFSFYMNNFSNYSLIYGSIGAFIMLLVWIYISCLILLVGALINYTIHTIPQKDDTNVNKK